MKLAIMQPYFLPYVGYFQLIAAVDQFIVYDDVQYMKGGWINRNRILENGQAKWLTLPVQQDNYLLHINQRRFSNSYEYETQKILKRLRHAYAGAPYLSSTMAVLEKVFDTTESNVSHVLTHQLKLISKYLGIDTPIVMSSSFDARPDLMGQDRVLALCEQLGAKTYINPIGGTELYDSAAFQARGINLCFVKSKELAYPQFNDQFVPWLSIVDVMMFNSVEEIASHLQNFELVQNSAFS